MTTLQDERVAHLVRLCAQASTVLFPGGFRVTTSLSGNGCFCAFSGKELAQRQLSERANLTEPTVRTALIKMEQRPHTPTAQRGRQAQTICLSERGRELRRILEPLAVDANDTAMAGLDANQHALHRMLIHILANLETDRPKPKRGVSAFRQPGIGPVT